LTEAVRGALRLRLRDEQPKRGEAPWDDAEIDAILGRFRALPTLDDRTDDEILGYDENGLPS
jgi:antitoxin VapB